MIIGQNHHTARGFIPIFIAGDTIYITLIRSILGITGFLSNITKNNITDIDYQTGSRESKHIEFQRPLSLSL